MPMAEQSRETEILRSIIDETEYNKPPQSRNEEILISILNETEYTKNPQSREEELLLELKAKIETQPPAVIKRVTGNPIEFNDGADAPLVKCVTQIQGSQDLHGHGKPWAPGAGKNKLPYATSSTQTGVSFTVGDDGSIHIVADGTLPSATYISIYVSLTVGITYTASGISGSGDDKCRIYLRKGDGSATAIEYFTSGSRTWTQDAGDNAVGEYRIRVSAGAVLDVTVYPMIEIGSPATSYEPYSNICPITAYTEGEIEVSDGDGNVTTHTTTYPSAIYRGSEDCVNGEVGYDMPMVDLGDLTWEYVSSNDCFRAGLLDMKKYSYPTMPNWKCSCYEVTGARYLSNMAGMPTGAICPYSDNAIIFVKDTRYTDATTFTTAIAGQTLAYELATPTTSSVTPTNLPVKSLSGFNHIESSTGNLNVDYITDVYQEFVNTVESALPNTRKGGVKAMDIFLALDPDNNKKTEEVVDSIEKTK